MSEHELTHASETNVTEQAECCGETTCERPVLRKARPNVRILERDAEIVIQAEMPGVDESHVEVTFDRKVLSISGEYFGDEFDGFTVGYREFGPVRYERAFTIHEDVDRESIDATLADGVLTVTLNKIVPEKTKVEVRVK